MLRCFSCSTCCCFSCCGRGWKTSHHEGKCVQSNAAAAKSKTSQSAMGDPSSHPKPTGAKHADDIELVCSVRCNYENATHIPVRPPTFRVDTSYDRGKYDVFRSRCARRCESPSEAPDYSFIEERVERIGRKERWVGGCVRAWVVGCV